MSKNIAVFASGTGSNFIEIHHACETGEIDAKLNFFFSDRKNSRALARARELNLNTLCLNLKDFENKADFEARLLEEMEKYNIDLIVLAGYMKIVGTKLLQQYPKRIINIHPSLLPEYRGKDALIRQHAKQESQVGISIHYIDEGIDTGEIIFQRSLEVEYPIELEELESMIHNLEHENYKLVIKKVLEDLT